MSTAKDVLTAWSGFFQDVTTAYTCVEHAKLAEPLALFAPAYQRLLVFLDTNESSLAHLARIGGSALAQRYEPLQEYFRSPREKQAAANIVSALEEQLRAASHTGDAL